MGLVRMFHYGCDSGIARYDCEDSTADEWYQSLALSEAKQEGWHVSAKGVAICPACWELGARYKDIKE